MWMKREFLEGEIHMLKISKKYSVILSMVLSVIFFIAIIVGAIIMPGLVENLIKLPAQIGAIGEITPLACILINLAAYIILAFGVIANIMIFSLLIRVHRSEVFSEKSVALIRGISWCCILVGVIFLALGYYFKLSFIVAFVVMFLGLCIRVVKNVMEEATAIKSENDLTV